MKRIEKDHIPVEVATEMLTTKGARMSNRERKMYLRARQTEWAAGVPRKPLAEKLAARTAGRGIAWLGRELRRAGKHRRGVQRLYEGLARFENTPVIARHRAILDLRAGHLDTVMDVIQDTIRFRLNR